MVAQDAMGGANSFMQNFQIYAIRMAKIQKVSLWCLD
jgi:hypothetical protein